MVLIKIPPAAFFTWHLKLWGSLSQKRIPLLSNGFFGTTPEGANALFVDLQTTEIEDAVAKEINLG